VTTIRFTLPADSRVRLDVYDVRGQRIRTLTDDHRAAGPHSIVWDGRDATGRTVASGTYFARLVSDAGVLTRKMLLAK
jgi:flagellar hook assembly protein FlgD